MTTWPVSAVQSKGSTGSMIGGSGSLRAKIARTKSSPDIDAMTGSGVTPYSTLGTVLSLMRRSGLRLLRPHQIGKALEQIMRVARARGGFRVILHGKHRLAVERDAAIGAVEQRDVRLGGALRQRCLIHGKAVVHR